eukprot:1119787-Rhodomonas_salina.1
MKTVRRGERVEIKRVEEGGEGRRAEGSKAEREVESGGRSHCRPPSSSFWRPHTLGQRWDARAGAEEGGPGVGAGEFGGGGAAREGARGAALHGLLARERGGEIGVFAGERARELRAAAWLLLLVFLLLRLLRRAKHELAVQDALRAPAFHPRFRVDAQRRRSAL